MVNYTNKFQINEDTNLTLITRNDDNGAITGIRVGTNGPQFKAFDDSDWTQITKPDAIGVFLGGVATQASLPATVTAAQALWPGKSIVNGSYCIVSSDETHQNKPAFYIINNITSAAIAWLLLAVLDIDISTKLDKGFAGNSILKTYTVDDITPGTLASIDFTQVSTDGLDTTITTKLPIVSLAFLH
ncbi:MAG: hypothetical protein LBB45_05990 [Methanobrevibacter sp.]|jgi:hypothetical protein|nr:hypothetical protein [Candidatus Methanovirga basalitermitum]